jgi:hypothetical protein
MCSAPAAWSKTGALPVLCEGGGRSSHRGRDDFELRVDERGCEFSGLMRSLEIAWPTTRSSPAAGLALRGVRGDALSC